MTIYRFTVEIDLGDDVPQERRESDVDVCRTATQHVCWDNLEHHTNSTVMVGPWEVVNPEPRLVQVALPCTVDPDEDTLSIRAFDLEPGRELIYLGVTHGEDTDVRCQSAVVKLRDLRRALAAVVGS
jgi:hypothetical protein